MDYFKDTAIGPSPQRLTMRLRAINNTITFWFSLKSCTNIAEPCALSKNKNFRKVHKGKRSKRSIGFPGCTNNIAYGLKISVYHKPTFTRKYLNFNFH